MDIKSIQNQFSQDEDTIREAKGAALFANGNVVMTEDAFYVQSDSDPNVVYKVDGVSCECPDYQKRKKACKHLHAVEFYFLANGGSQ